MTADDQARLDALTPDRLWQLKRRIVNVAEQHEWAAANADAYGRNDGSSASLREQAWECRNLAALCEAVAAAQLVVQRDPDVALVLYDDDDSGQIGVERRHESGLVEWSTGAPTLAAALGAVSETTDA